MDITIHPQHHKTKRIAGGQPLFIGLDQVQADHLPSGTSSSSTGPRLQRIHQEIAPNHPDAAAFPSPTHGVENLLPMRLPWRDTILLGLEQDDSLGECRRWTKVNDRPVDRGSQPGCITLQEDQMSQSRREELGPTPAWNLDDSEVI